MKRLATFFTLSLLTFLLTFCDSGTDPIQLEPGSRNYELFQDTIKFIYNGYDRIWGSSPDDLWISAHGGPDGAVLLHKQDGEWRIAGHKNMNSIWSIWGSGKHDVWAGTDDGEIWHYGEDEQWSWEAGFIYQPDPNKRIVFQDISGRNSNDVYAVGTVFGETDNEHPFLATYNGIKWSIKYFPKLGGAFIRIKGDSKNRAFILAYKWSNINQDSTFFYEYKDGLVKRVFAAIDNSVNRSNLQSINGEVIFLIGEQLHSYKSGRLIPFYTNTAPRILAQLYGRNLKDIIIPGMFGLSHYNGIDQDNLINFLPLPDYMVYVRDGILFKEDFFFLADDNSLNKNIIIHGKLMK